MYEPIGVMPRYFVGSNVITACISHMQVFVDTTIASQRTVFSILSGFLDPNLRKVICRSSATDEARTCSARESCLHFSSCAVYQGPYLEDSRQNVLFFSSDRIYIRRSNIAVILAFPSVPFQTPALRYRNSSTFSTYFSAVVHSLFSRHKDYDTIISGFLFAKSNSNSPAVQRASLIFPQSVLYTKLFSFFYSALPVTCKYLLDQPHRPRSIADNVVTLQPVVPKSLVSSCYESSS